MTSDVLSWVNWVKGTDRSEALASVFWEQGFGSSASNHADLVTALLSWRKGQPWGQARPENCPGTSHPKTFSQVGQASEATVLTSQRAVTTALPTSREHGKLRRLENGIKSLVEPFVGPDAQQGA